MLEHERKCTEMPSFTRACIIKKITIFYQTNFKIHPHKAIQNCVEIHNYLSNHVNLHGCYSFFI